MVRVARLPLQVGGHLLGLLTTAPDCLVADRQMSERMASDARKREQFQRLKEQFVKDQEVGGGGLVGGGMGERGLEGSASPAGPHGVFCSDAGRPGRRSWMRTSAMPVSSGTGRGG